MTRPAITAFALVLAATAAACTVYPAEPASPTFTKDVHPIFMAHCVRCHGAQNQLTNEVDGSLSGTIECYLDQMADRGDCTLVDGGVPPLSQCMPGAKFCATSILGSSPLLEIYLFRFTQETGGMPPLPSPPLNEWEKTVVRRWIDNGAPP